MDDPRHTDHRAPFQRDGADRRHGDRGENRIARVLVPSDTDLAHIEVTELKLGPADITTYSPSLEELSGSSFESVRFVDVTCHGITERWLLYVEPTNVKVALRATDLWNNTATATALVSAEEYAAGAALEYRIKGATEWQRMAESSYEAGILTATLAPEWSSSTNPTGLPSTTSCRTRVSSQGTPTNSA